MELLGDDTDEMLIADFVGCIREGLPVTISGEDRFAAAAVALVAYESVKTGEPADVEGSAADA